LDGGINVYGYVGGNPIGFVDPLGLFFNYDPSCPWYVILTGGCDKIPGSTAEERAKKWAEKFFEDKLKDVCTSGCSVIHKRCRQLIMTICNATVCVIPCDEEKSKCDAFFKKECGLACLAPSSSTA
jgi:hypothetical protein